MTYRIVLLIKNEAGVEENALIFPGFETKDSALNMFGFMAGNLINLFKGHLDKEIDGN